MRPYGLSTGIGSRRPPERPLDSGSQLLHCVRFLDEWRVIGNAEAVRFLATVTAGHEDRKVRPLPPDCRKCLRPAPNRHDDVEQHQTHVTMPVHQFQCLPPIFGEQNPVPGLLEGSLHERPNGFFIVYTQHRNGLVAGRHRVPDAGFGRRW